LRVEGELTMTIDARGIPGAARDESALNLGGSVV
jgi:hypothetical protein